MAIDRIGGGKGLSPTALEQPKLGGLERAGRGAELGRAERAESGAAAHTEGTERAGAVEQVRDGSLAIDDYLERHVQEATAHLDGGLNADQLGLVQDQLREQLATDPWVRQLVLEACGQLPASDPQ